MHLNEGSKLHLYCDASTKAYGAVVYVVDNTGRGRILTAKSKLSPSKTVTLPRLELMAACLGSMLLKTVCSALKVPISKALCWSDSKIVLAWISREKNDLKQFVGNRVGIIQGNTNVSNWNHIRSENNPADLVSRGLSIQDLRKNNLWWQGPSQREAGSPILDDEEMADVEKEIRNKKPTRTALNTTIELGIRNVIEVDRYSSWRRLIRVTARVLQFIKNCRVQANNRSYDVTSSDLKAAEDHWVKDMQMEWKEDIDRLRLQEEAPPSSKLSLLLPFVDEDGFLRSKGRLQNADVEDCMKQPLILSNCHPATISS